MARHIDITVDSSLEYLNRMADVVARAFVNNPNWRVMFPSSDEERIERYKQVVRHQIGPSLESGAFIVEAVDFTACAAWFPPGSHNAPRGDQPDWNEIDKARHKHIWSKYGQDHWSLMLIARDPARENVPGIVSAIMRPFMQRATQEGRPIWLSTTSEHAKNIYLHYGWQVVHTAFDQGKSTWAMVLHPGL